MFSVGTVIKVIPVIPWNMLESSMVMILRQHYLPDIEQLDSVYDMKCLYCDTTFSKTLNLRIQTAKAWSNLLEILKKKCSKVAHIIII